MDVARHAGVSKSTVSLVLQKSSLVKESTRAQIEDSMAAVNYVYNRSAAGLRGVASGLVGLVINDLRNPFYTEFAASAQMAFARAGYSTVIANTDEDPEIQAQVIDAMIEHGVSAFLIAPTYGESGGCFERIERAGIPAMQVLRQIGERTGAFPFASLDFVGGGTLATRHLLDLGCRNIAFVGGLEARPITLERMAGYIQVMEDAGLETRIFPGRPSRAVGRELAHRLARDHREIEAAVCFSDLVALGMLSGFAELGVELGSEFRLVGFDDIEECSLVYPQLSSVCCNTKRFGEYSARTMLGWIAGGPRPQDSYRAPVTLVARQSSLGVRPAGTQGPGGT